MPALCQVEKTGKLGNVVQKNHPHSDFWNLSAVYPCCGRRGCWPLGSAPSDILQSRGASRLGPLGFGCAESSVTSPGSGNSLPEAAAVAFWSGSPCPVSCCLTLLPPAPGGHLGAGVLGLMPREMSRCTLCFLGRWEGADRSASGRGVGRACGAGKAIRLTERLADERCGQVCVVCPGVHWVMCSCQALVGTHPVLSTLTSSTGGVPLMSPLGACGPPSCRPLTWACGEGNQGRKGGRF